MVSVKDVGVANLLNTKINYNSMTPYASPNVNYFSMILIDSKGKTIVNQYITFNLNGVNSKVKTDAKGIAKVKINRLSGTFYLNAKFAGNNYKS